MLRQADWDKPHLGQFADRHFAMLDQLAEEHQATVISDRRQRVGDLPGPGLEGTSINRLVSLSY